MFKITSIQIIILLMMFSCRDKVDSFSVILMGRIDNVSMNYDRKFISLKSDDLKIIIELMNKCRIKYNGPIIQGAELTVFVFQAGKNSIELHLLDIKDNCIFWIEGEEDQFIVVGNENYLRLKSLLSKLKSQS